MKPLFLFILFVSMTACATRPIANHTEDNAQGDESINHQSAPSNSGVTLLPPPVEFIMQPIIACDAYSKLDTDGQKKQLIETQQTLAKNKQNLLHRIKLSCMYALPTSYIKDSLKAHVLLQQLREDETIADADKAFINHLYLFNNENIKQLQKVRDDARALDNISQKYEMLEKKYEASEQKLMQLKNIEKKLNVR